MNAPSSRRGACWSLERGRALLVCAAALLAGGRGREVGAQADSRGRLVVLVQGAEGGGALAYATVGAPALGLQRLTDARGAVQVEAPAGGYRVSARRVGYAPSEVAVTVRGGGVDAVRVRLRRLALQLAAVRVRGAAGCTNPGPPSSATDPELAAVVEQFRQNATVSQLFGTTYPFMARVERRALRVTRGGRAVADSAEIAEYASAPAAGRAPGEVVMDRGGGARGSEVRVVIPTLRDMADDRFWAGDCFAWAGVDTVAGGRFARVNFLAPTVGAVAGGAEAAVEGAIYLDTASYRLRRIVVRLARVPGLLALAGVDEVGATTDFGDLLSAAPVLTRVAAVSRYRGARRDGEVAELREEQRLTGVHFFVRPPGLGLGGAARVAVGDASVVPEADGAWELDAAGRARLRLVGLAYDSLHARPLGGATVLVAPADSAAAEGDLWMGRTDADGRYAIEAVAPGRYRVGVTAPVLDSLGVVVPDAVVEFRPGLPTRYDVYVPSGRALVAALCAGRAAGGRDGDRGRGGRVPRVWDSVRRGGRDGAGARARGGGGAFGVRRGAGADRGTRGARPLGGARPSGDARGDGGRPGGGAGRGGVGAPRGRRGGGRRDGACGRAFRAGRDSGGLTDGGGVSDRVRGAAGRGRPAARGYDGRDGAHAGGGAADGRGAGDGGAAAALVGAGRERVRGPNSRRGGVLCDARAAGSGG